MIIILIITTIIIIIISKQYHALCWQPQAESVAEKCEYQGLGSVDGTASLPPPEKPQRFRPLPLGAPLSLLLHFRDTDPPPGGGSDEEGLGGEEEGGGSSSSAVNGNCSSLELQPLVNVGIRNWCLG